MQLGFFCIVVVYTPMHISELIDIFLQGTYSTPELQQKADEYQETFAEEGFRKSSWILEEITKLSQEHSLPLDKMGYISIGGADGSEIENILMNTPINYGVLLEYDTGASEKARLKGSKLSDIGKKLHVIQGDALSRIDEAFTHLKSNGCELVCVSAQAILHELPNRSASFRGFDHFTAKIFSGFETTILISREPCRPLELPPDVEVHISEVPAKKLEAFIKLVADHLRFSRNDTFIHPNGFVQLDSVLCVEVLHKVLRSQSLSELKYELGETLTSLNTEELQDYLVSICGPTNVHVNYLTTDGFIKAYKTAKVTIRDTSAKKNPLTIPKTHAKISAIRLSNIKEESSTQTIKPVSKKSASSNELLRDNVLSSNYLSKRLTQLTKQMSHRANLIQKATYDGEFNFKEILLSNGLYVKRELEKQILDEITKSPENYSLISIKGEPGFGKSSILWSLEKTLSENPNRITWLIDADDLINLFGVYKNGIFSNLSDFENLLINLNPYGQVTILIDTVDAVLNREKDSDLFCNLISDLKALSVIIILATRPLEAKILDFLEPTERVLSKYNELEFIEATESYSKAFLNDPTDQKTHSKQLNLAVAQGLPIKEVAYNPLALRMLYSVYAPLQINFQEINIVSLYRTYWQKKVETDSRSVIANTKKPQVNLTRAASILGVTLLAEGRQEISQSLALRYLEQSGELINTLEQLADRGVLTKNQMIAENRITFFHQTFFEHAAAVGILEHARGLGLEALFERYKKTDGNDFIAAILEKALVLSEFETHMISRLAIKIVCELLQTNNQYVTTGIYAFVHRTTYSDQIYQNVKSLFENSNKLAIENYLNLFDNITIEQRPQHYDLLKLALRIKSNRINEIILQKISHISQYNKEVAKQFLEDGEVIKLIGDTLESNSNGRKYYHESLSAISAEYPEWARSKYVELLGVAVGKSYGDSELEWILSAFAGDLPNELRLSTEEIETAIGPGDRKINDLNQRSLAKFLFQDMVLRNESHLDLFDLVSIQKHNSRIYYIRLMAVTEYLFQMSYTDLKSFLRKCYSVKNQFAFRNLALISWLNFLEITLNSAESSEVESAENLIFELLDGFEYKKLTAKHRFALILFQSSELLVSTADKFFKVDDSNAYEFWTNKSLMGSKLAQAYMGGNLQAKEVVAQILKSRKVTLKLANTLARQFGFYIQNSEAMIIGVQLASIGNDPDTQLKLLEQLEGDFSKKEKYFSELVPTYNMCSSKGDNYSRRRRARYERQFSKLGLKYRADHLEQQKHLKAAKDLVEREVRLDTYNYHLKNGDFEATSKEIDWLLSLTKNAEGTVKTNLIQSICTVLYKNPSLSPRYFDRLFEFATTPDSHASDLHPVSRVMYEAHEQKLFDVAHYCRLFFERAKNMSNKTVQGIYNRFAKLFLIVSRKAPDEWVISMVSKMAHVNHELGRILLPTLQTLPEGLFKIICDVILKSPKTPSATVRKVLDVKRRYETRHGIDEWTEIYDLCFNTERNENSRVDA